MTTTLGIVTSALTFGAVLLVVGFALYRISKR